MAQIHALTPEGRLPSQAVAHVKDIVAEAQHWSPEMPANATYPQSVPPMIWVSGGTAHLSLYTLGSADGASVEIPLPEGLWPPQAVLSALYGGSSARVLVRPEGRASVLGFPAGGTVHGVATWPIGAA